MPTERWLRINVSWSDSEWLFDQPPGIRLAWIEMLCYTKQNGMSGRVKSMSPTVASSKWRISKDDIVTLQTVAQRDGALQIEDGDWIIANWCKYQAESLDRVKRFREKERTKEKDSPSQSIENNNNTERDTETETREVTRVTRVTLQPLRNVTASTESVNLSPLGQYLVSNWHDITPVKACQLESLAIDACPGVDLLAEAKRAFAWEQASKSNKKTDHARFINNWWSRSQDRPKQQPQLFKPPPRNIPDSTKMAEYKKKEITIG
jgi:hypothetical protein